LAHGPPVASGSTDVKHGGAYFRRLAPLVHCLTLGVILCR
jgi:hypothetical protein